MPQQPNPQAPAQPMQQRNPALGTQPAPHPGHQLQHQAQARAQLINSQAQHQQRVALSGQAIVRLLNFINEVGRFHVSFLLS
jgi:hypothetical protein